MVLMYKLLVVDGSYLVPLLPLRHFTCLPCNEIVTKRIYSCGHEIQIQYREDPYTFAYSCTIWHPDYMLYLAIIGLHFLFLATVEPPNKGHFGNGPLVLCSEIVPISEVHDFSTHFDCIILNKLVNALKCMIRTVEISG